MTSHDLSGDMGPIGFLPVIVFVGGILKIDFSEGPLTHTPQYRFDLMSKNISNAQAMVRKTSLKNGRNDVVLGGYQYRHHHTFGISKLAYPAAIPPVSATPSSTSCFFRVFPYLRVEVNFSYLVIKSIFYNFHYEFAACSSGCSSGGSDDFDMASKLPLLFVKFVSEFLYSIP